MDVTCVSNNNHFRARNMTNTDQNMTNTDQNMTNTDQNMTALGFGTISGAGRGVG